MKEYNGEKYIVSFTSFGQRFDDACKMIFSLQKQTYKNFHLVMTIFEGDVKDITPNLQLFIDNDILEVIVAPENLCPHLKYFYAMKKYWDKPIITVDDDRICHPKLLEFLISKYESLKYKSVVSVSAPIMTRNAKTINERIKWSKPEYRLKPNRKSFLAVAEGFAGVLYPACCFVKLDEYLDLIKKCLYDDDICLKVMEILEKIPVTQINGNESNVLGCNIGETQNHCLAKRTPGNMKYRNNLTLQLNKFLLQGWCL